MGGSLSITFAEDAKDIIGKPIKIGNLLVAENDFPDDLTWDEAKKACQSLGKGWRLPTKTELNVVFKNKNKIGGLTNCNYWSSTETDYGENGIWGVYQGFKEGSQNETFKSNKFTVRAINVLSP